MPPTAPDDHDEEAIWVDDAVASISEPLHIPAASVPTFHRDSERRKIAPPPLPKAPEIVELVPRMLERLSEGEYRDALALAERILALDEEHIDALQCAALCHGELQKMLLDRLGPLSRKSDNKLSLPPPSAGTDPLDALSARMFDRLASGKYAAALMAAEELLQKDPQSADARECAALARSELRKLYASRLGDLQRVPVHTLRTEAPRDAEVRAVWDKVDGVRSMQDLIDSGSSSTLDLLRVLYELLLEGRIELRALSLGSMSRIHLVHGPTPLVRLPRLSDQLAVDLWIKRDDADGGVEAGNKLRKLEYLVGDALDRGCDTLITCGALQSNHCRATAAIAARFGLSCVLMLRTNDISAPLPLTGNVLLMRVLGADIHLITPAQYRDRDSLLQATADTLRRTGKKPYVIPEGGSNGLGSLGYVEAMREVRVQLDLGIADGKPFDMIVHACGSGGTAAGVALGAARSNVAAEVRAVAVCDDVAYFQRVIDRIIGEARSLSPELKDCARVVIDDTAKGPAYGATTHEQRAFLIDVARRHGLVLDPVYTGKALFGLAQAIHRDGSLVGKRVLFLHTGGLPGLLAQGDLFADELA